MEGGAGELRLWGWTDESRQELLVWLEGMVFHEGHVPQLGLGKRGMERKRLEWELG